MLKKQVSVLRLISPIVSKAWVQPNLIRSNVSPRDIEALDPKFHGLSDADMALQFNMGEGDLPIAANCLCPKSSATSNKPTAATSHWNISIFPIPKSAAGYALILKAYCPHRTQCRSKRRILKEMTAAETLERYLHTKYVGQKRFGVEARRKRDCLFELPDSKRL